MCKKIIICKKCNEKGSHGAFGLCRKCYNNSRKELCSICGKLKIVNARNDGNPLCSNCYAHSKPKEKCCKCKKEKYVHFRLNNLYPTCEKCYKQYFRKKEKCDVCKKISIIVKCEYNQKLCGTCYKNKNIKRCYICGETKPINKKTENGDICGACYMKEYNRPKKLCDECGKNKIIEKIINNKKYCSTCNRKRPEEKARCFNNRTNYRSLININGEISGKEWFSIMKSTNWKCFYCGKSISSKNNRTIDHIIPITAGGKHCISNLVPCCRSCNASKGNRNVFKWIKSKNIILSIEKLKILGVN